MGVGAVDRVGRAARAVAWLVSRLPVVLPQVGPPNGAPNPNGGRPGAGGFPGGLPPAARQQAALASRRLQFCLDEGAILLVDPGTRGDGGTLFVQQATVPQPIPPTPPATPTTPPADGAGSPAQPGATARYARQARPEPRGGQARGGERQP